MIKENMIVASTKGRDIDTIYIVFGVVDGFAYLFDGKSKKENNLKKKNLKHLKVVDDTLNLDFKSMKTCDIIHWLKIYKQKLSSGGINSSVKK